MAQKMKILSIILIIAALFLSTACSGQSHPQKQKLSTSGGTAMTNIIYKIPVKTIDGQTTNLAQYIDKIMLIVNTASKCGYTPQYKGLETLYKKYKDKGLVVLGFPCNQFMSQEPGTESEIKKFCELNYGVTFPMFSKINVNGKNAHLLYEELKKRAPGIMGTESIKWNFTKFLVCPNGETVKRFSTATKPEEIENEIDKMLKNR